MPMLLNEWRKFLDEAMVDVLTGTTSAARSALNKAIDDGVFDELDRNAIDNVITKLDSMIG